MSDQVEKKEKPDFKKEKIDEDAFLNYIRKNVVGVNCKMESPFGTKRMLYMDYTASGRVLRCIEDVITKLVYPTYANTHTVASNTGLQTTIFVEEARRQVLNSCTGTSDDAVIFTGSGTTGAVNRLCDIIGIRKFPSDYVVIVGPYEHHSNLLPWKEAGAQVIYAQENHKVGGIDMKALEELLKALSKGSKQIIGAFSAASNITGIFPNQELEDGEEFDFQTQINKMVVLLHKYNAWSFWDYASAGPHKRIIMNPLGMNDITCKDAIYCSPHKYLGGVGCPGLLIMKRSLRKNKIPSQPGGGTVRLVSKEETVYYEDLEVREQGGTPPIIGIIRAGLMFHLRDVYPKGFLESREEYILKKIWNKLDNVPNLQICDRRKSEGYAPKRIAIVSFLIKCGRGFLHPGFVSILMNDLFGIQSRAGCMCAGPYAQSILSIDEKMGIVKDIVIQEKRVYFFFEKNNEKRFTHQRK